ncbi:MAG: hypothetical protein D6740_04335 [Alphaproteobacteria bacterium]|nr:MAG: hypothetical protein D6740_04335 [Alphaproteobacteria bacterium]
MRRAGLILAIIGWMLVPAAAQQLIWLGPLEGVASSKATDVTWHDGQLVVVGSADFGSGWPHAFRWTPQTGMIDLGTLSSSPFASSSAAAIDPTGTWITGVTDVESGAAHVFLWSAATGMTDLGAVGDTALTSVSAVSSDGMRVAGAAESPHPRAVAWTQGSGWAFLFDTDWASHAHAMTADGQTIVGSFSYPDNGPNSAFRWTAAGGVEDLNQTYAALLGGLPPSFLDGARGISPDGRYIVGGGFNGQTLRPEPYLLDTQTPFVRFLGLPGNAIYAAEARDVSADGQVVVGTALASTMPVGRAFWWTPDTGIEDLNAVFADALSDGSWLSEALAVSPDGRYIVGYGSHAATNSTQAWLIDRLGTTTEAGEAAGMTIGWQCYPNPFREVLWVQLDLPQAMPLRLAVAAADGREVAVVHDGWLHAGRHQWSWTGRDAAGRRLPEGVYILTARGPRVSLSQKVVLLP